MTPLDTAIRTSILRVLWTAKNPMPEAAIKEHLRGVFRHVAFSDSQIEGHIKGAQEAGLIDGTDDEISGMMWDLSPRGKIHAQKL